MVFQRVSPNPCGRRRSRPIAMLRALPSCNKDHRTAANGIAHLNVGAGIARLARLSVTCCRPNSSKWLMSKVLVNTNTQQASDTAATIAASSGLSICQTIAGIGRRLDANALGPSRDLPDSPSGSDEDCSSPTGSREAVAASRSHRM